MITRCLPCLPLLVVLTAAGAETVKLAEPGAVLPYGETREYRFTPTGAWQSVRLRLTVRMDAPSAAGSTHVMGLALNGQGIQGALSRTQLRLLNKPLDAKMAGGTEIVWVRGDQWRAVYSPDFELVASPKAGSSRILDVSPYELVIDISDLVRKGQENVLTIRHLGAGIGLRKYFQDNPTLDLVFAEMAVELSDQPPAAAAVAAGESLSADRVMWQPPAVCDAAQVVTLAADGGLTVKLPGQTLELVSRFSWQGGSHNTFGADPACRAQDGWQVAVSGGGAERTVTGSGPDYRVTRVIRWVGDHVEVSDTLENRTDDDLGLLFDNALRARPDELGEVFLGGDPDPARTVSTLYENPTLFVAGRTSGCGLLARDDVYRVKGVIYYDQGGGIRSDDFCLPRLGGATICWSLYPVLRPDYYDFINLARRDLQVNFTVPGNATLGNTVMRVRVVFPDTEAGEPETAEPCINYTWGETEDYSIVITTATAIGEENPGGLSLQNGPEQVLVTWHAADQGGQVLVMDASGRTVFAQEAGSNQLAIRTTELAPGLYHVLVILRGERFSARFAVGSH